MSKVSRRGFLRKQCLLAAAAAVMPAAVEATGRPALPEGLVAVPVRMSGSGWNVGIVDASAPPYVPPPEPKGPEIWLFNPSRTESVDVHGVFVGPRTLWLPASGARMPEWYAEGRYGWHAPMEYR